MKSRSDVQLPKRDESYTYNGAHGFDPREEKMRAIFFASGPDFVEDSKIPGIKNVDVYPLLAHLLKVQPLPNNGSISAVKMALKSGDDMSGVAVVTASIWPFIVFITLKFVV